MSSFCGSLISSLVTSQGPSGPKLLGALALDPLPGALDLEHALGNVVGEAIAGDHVQCLVLRQVTRALADDDAELDLPVELGRSFGMIVSSLGPQMQDVALLKMIGSFGIGMPALGGMVGIVQADGDEIADLPTQAPRRGLPRTSGSLSIGALRILASPLGDSASPAMSGTTCERSRIAPLASMIPGFSRPRRAEADELHRVCPWG